jgi:hypothetical protein
MNIPNVNKLLHELRTAEQFPNHSFGMNEWFDREHCGTLGCFAGTAALLANPHYSGSWPRAIAARWLGLSGTMADELFLPNSDIVHYNRVTRQIAADVLENFRNTGAVEWPESVKRC